MSASGRSFLRGSSLCFVANCAFVAFGLFTGVLLARGLGAAGRGLLTTVIAWPLILTSMSGLSLYDAILWLATREPQLRPRLYGTAIVASLAQAGLVALGALVLLPRFLRLTAEQDRLMTINLLLLPLWLGVELTGAIVHSHQRFDRVALTRVIAPLISAPIVLGLFLSQRLSPSTAMLAQWAGLLAQATLTTSYCLRAGDFSWRPDFRLYRRALSYAIRIHVGTLAGLGARRIDHLTLTVISTARPLGLYAFAKTLTELLNNVSASVVIVLFPRLSSEPCPQLRGRLAVRSARWTLIISVAGALAVHGLAPLFLRRIWGADFVDALPLVDWLLPGAVLVGLRNTLASALLAAGRNFAGSAAELISLAVVVPSLAFFIARDGAVGAAMAVSLGAAVNCGVVLVLFARTFGARAAVAILFDVERDGHLARSWSALRSAILSPRRLTPALDAVVFITLVLTPVVFLPCPFDAFALPPESGRRLFIEALCRPKGWCAAIGTLLALAGTLLEHRRAPTPTTRALRLLAFGAALQLGCFTATLACASDRLTALAELRGYFCMAGMFLVTCASPRRASAVLAAVATAATIVAATILVELRGHHLPGLGRAVDAWLVRPTAMMPHRNVAAASLFLGIPALVASAVGPARGWRRALALAALALVAAALVATGSRASMAAALVSIVVMFIRSPALRAAAKRHGAALAATIAAAVALRSVHAQATAVPLATKLLRMFHGADVSSRDHLALWRFAVHHMIQSPFVGAGGSAFVRAWSLANPANPMPGTHDVWLQLGASYGAVSFVLWMAAAGWLALRLLRRSPADGEWIGNAAVAGALAGALVLALVENVTDMVGCNIQLAALGGALFFRTTGDRSHGQHHPGSAT